MTKVSSDRRHDDATHPRVKLRQVGTVLGTEVGDEEGSVVGLDLGEDDRWYHVQIVTCTHDNQI